MMDWLEDAACKAKDSETFFPERGENSAHYAAKAICATCPVSAECLDYALANNERFGVWGGLSWNERQKERRKRNMVKRRGGSRPQPVKHATDAGYMAHRRRGEDPCRECRAAHAFADLHRHRQLSREALARSYNLVETAS